VIAASDRRCTGTEQGTGPGSKAGAASVEGGGYKRQATAGSSQGSDVAVMAGKAASFPGEPGPVGHRSVWCTYARAVAYPVSRDASMDGRVGRVFAAGERGVPARAAL
jgi:hypothetical protein